MFKPFFFIQQSPKFSFKRSTKFGCEDNRDYKIRVGGLDSIPLSFD